MSDEFHLRVQELLERALSLDSAQRQAYLKRECGRNDLLLQEVLSLLPITSMRAFELSAAKDGPRIAGHDNIREIAWRWSRSRGIGARAAVRLGQYRVVQYWGAECARVRPSTPRYARNSRSRCAQGPCLYEDRWRFAFEAHILRQDAAPGIAGITHAARSAPPRAPAIFVMNNQGQSLIKR